jgi:hypothetical protein
MAVSFIGRSNQIYKEEITNLAEITESTNFISKIVSNMSVFLAKILCRHFFQEDHLICTVFTKNFSNLKPTGPVNHKNPQAQILFCWPEKKSNFSNLGVFLSLFFFFNYYFKHYLSL